jgi:eukaryotic-like serine/threonine-protein kinase
VSDDSVRDRLQATLGAAYRLDRELGGGGMSRVFVAQETALGRTVVVKVLSPELAEGLNCDRFRREVQLAARLQHPHIVPLLTAGESGGLPYFTMPFIQGESLRQRLVSQGELPVNEAVRILREIASALAYAHTEGVVHRDIKPDNVLISGGAAMVTDFGVAKALSDAAQVGGAQLTQFGVALGTPAYMAPEQAAADPATDHRADIYAFGATAYELLTGETPFAGRPAQAMLAAHAVETAESVARRRPAVPEGLGALVMRCLEKRPADRPQTAAELVRVLDNLPQSTGAIRATTATPRRSRGWLVGASLGALVVIGGAAVFVARQHAGFAAAPNGQTMLAVLPFENQGPAADEYFAGGLTEAITNRLASLHGLGVIDSRSAGQYKNTTKSLKTVGRELGVQYVLEGTVRWAGHQVEITPDLVNVADLTTKPAGGPYLVDPSDVFQVQTEVATKVVDALSLTLTGDERKALTDRPTNNPAAYDAFLRGLEYDHRIVTLSGPVEQAMDAYTQAVSLDSTFALAYARLAQVQLIWAILNPPDTARLSRALQSIATARRLQPDLPDLHQAQAVYLDFFRKDVNGAYQEVLRAHAGLPNDAEILSNLGHLQIERGLDSGFVNLDQAVKLDPRSPDVIHSAFQENYRYRRYADAAHYADMYVALEPASPIGYNQRIQVDLDGKGDTAAARRTIAQAASQGVPMSVDLAGQLLYLGPAGRDQYRRLALADVHAATFLDTLQYYLGQRLAHLETQPTVARALGDSIVRLAQTPRLAGVLALGKPILLGFGYAATGRRDDARREVASLEQSLAHQQYQNAETDGNSEQALGAIFATLGEPDSAIAHVRRALTLPTGVSMHSFSLDPAYLPLRGNPTWDRFLASGA